MKKQQTRGSAWGEWKEKWGEVRLATNLASITLTLTSRGDPLVPIASPNLESQALEPQVYICSLLSLNFYVINMVTSRKRMIKISQNTGPATLDSIVDWTSTGQTYIILTDNTGRFLVEYEGRYYFANIIAGSLYRLDGPKDLDSILSMFSQNKIQNIRMTEIMELDDTED